MPAPRPDRTLEPVTSERDPNSNRTTEASQPDTAGDSDRTGNYTPGVTGVTTAFGAVEVPGYEIEGVLGRGGMGVVYKARHVALKRTVALKMILAGGHAGARELARFRIEAEAVARLQHPNIVQIHEVGEAGGHPYFALEFVAGGTLAARIADRPLPSADAARLVESLARAMQLVHSRNVVHRDLKPANILLTAEGDRLSIDTPKITDFGLARHLDADSGETQAGAVMGTPSYMAPEQASGRTSEAGPPADIYALGAILYDCLAGRPPFKGTTLGETLDLVRTREPEPPSRVRSDVPPDLETICLKCLRKEPEKRYASAAELADDLARYRRGEPILARPVGRLERAVKWVKRNPLTAGAAVAVAVALALGATVSYLKYLDAEREKGVARHEAERATKARDFLVSILRLAETDVKGGNVTARQILAGAEARIAVEFADQPVLRAELLAAIEDVNRGIARRNPHAMILTASGPVRWRSAAGKEKAVAAHALVNLDDRFTLAADAQVRLVILSDFHTERLTPGREAVVGRTGCEPPDAVAERDADITMTFVKLPKGTYYKGWMGGVEAQPGVKTEIAEDFEIAVYDVTQGQWQEVMGENPCWFSRTRGGRNDILDISDEELRLFPVESVSWVRAQEFVGKLNEKARGRGYAYRLPTEAEWEYACRAGATTEADCAREFYLDAPADALSSERANFHGATPFGNAPVGPYLARPSRVGAYPPNGLGLCDMHGNVWQWCADQLDRFGAPLRVHRGGGWGGGGSDCRAGHRLLAPPGSKAFDLGFRLVRVRTP